MHGDLNTLITQVGKYFFFDLRLCYNQDFRSYYSTKNIHLTQICVFFHYFSLKHRTPDSKMLHTIWNSNTDIEQFHYDTARVSLITLNINIHFVYLKDVTSRERCSDR